MKKSELRQMMREELEEAAVPQEHSGELAKEFFKSIQKHSDIEKSELLKVITNQMAGLLLTASASDNMHKLTTGLKSLYTKV